MTGTAAVPGRWLFKTAAALMLVTAVAHTAGHVASMRRADPETLSLHRLLAEHREAAGLGMRPSALDVVAGLSMTMSVTLLALGLTSFVAASGPQTGEQLRLLRRLAWLDAGWVAALLLVYARHELLPPLIFCALIELALLTYLVVARPARS